MTTRKFPRLAFVDLETTGGAVSMDRITEVGIIEVDESGVREWSSLVNPDMPIPEFIQSLTGISDDMVRDAPTFAELADDIEARLADRVFIAHNARFDYGVLRHEFRRIGHDFRPPVLCTVRLSRKLFPEFARHNLDSLAERHQLQVSARHRALGDAQLIWQFWQKVHEEHSAELIDETIEKLINAPALPARLDFLDAESIPPVHGVYVFFGAKDEALYVGRANDLRHKILAHFSGERMSSREQELSRQVQRVEWTPTSGELGALLQESALIKKLMPPYNKRSCDNDEVCSWRLVQRQGKLMPVLTHTDDLFFGFDPTLHGLYGNASKAGDALRAIADANELCKAVLGLERVRAGKPCSARRVGKCRGACVGEESIASHNARVSAALQSQRLQVWPYAGPIAIREEEMTHVIDGWSYIGSARTGDEVIELLARGSQRFDRDVYQILQKWLPKLRDNIVAL